MHLLTFAEHIASSEAIAFMVTFFVIEFLSLCLCLIIVYEYRRLASKHTVLPAAIIGIENDTLIEEARTLLNIYIILTLLFTVLTSAIFIWQPYLS